MVRGWGDLWALVTCFLLVWQADNLLHGFGVLMALLF